MKQGYAMSDLEGAQKEGTRGKPARMAEEQMGFQPTKRFRPVSAGERM